MFHRLSIPIIVSVTIYQYYICFLLTFPNLVLFQFSLYWLLFAGPQLAAFRPTLAYWELAAIMPIKGIHQELGVSHSFSAG